MLSSYLSHGSSDDSPPARLGHGAELDRGGKIVLLYGPRQAGKTTLARKLLADRPSLRVLSLSGDDPADRRELEGQDAAALRRLVAGYDCLAVDEAQRIADIGLSLSRGLPRRGPGGEAEGSQGHRGSLRRVPTAGIFPEPPRGGDQDGQGILLRHGHPQHGHRQPGGNAPEGRLGAGYGRISSPPSGAKYWNIANLLPRLGSGVSGPEPSSTMSRKKTARCGASSSNTGTKRPGSPRPGREPIPARPTP